MNTLDIEHDNNDIQIEGQMSMFDYLDQKSPSPMVAVSKVFARCIKQMNLAEWKTFVYALTQIRWKEKNKRKVHLDKWELIKILGLQANDTDISAHLKRAIGDLWKHSGLEFEDRDQEYWDNGTFITRVRCYKDYVLVVFEEDYLPLFQELDGTKNPYITMWSNDLFSMQLERSIILYEHLRLHSDTRKTNTRIISTRDFKEMFNIPKDGQGSYMNNGHFERTLFEKKVILPACDGLRKCQMINLCINDDGLPYRKIKGHHGRIIGYELTWTVTDRPGIMSAAEQQEVNREIEKNPQVLKVAKDIVKGKKKPISNSKQAFANYEQRERVDYEALLAQIQQKGK